MNLERKLCTLFFSQFRYDRLFIHSLVALQDKFSLLALELFEPSFLEPGLRKPLSVARPLSVIKFSAFSSVSTTSSAFLILSGLEFYCRSISAMGLLAGIPPWDAEGSVVSWNLKAGLVCKSAKRFSALLFLHLMQQRTRKTPRSTPTTKTIEKVTRNYLVNKSISSSLPL